MYGRSGVQRGSPFARYAIPCTRSGWSMFWNRSTAVCSPSPSTATSIRVWSNAKRQLCVAIGPPSTIGTSPWVSRI